MKRIRVSIGGAVQQELAVDRELIVGRVEGVDIRINDGEVSSRHLRVRPAGDDVLVTDLGSTNGSTLDGGERLSEGAEVPLARGRKLMIGPAILEVVESAEQDGPRSSVPGLEPNTMVVDGAALQKQLVAVARFKAAAPRLVIGAEHDRRTVALPDMRTTVGRDGAACQVEIAHASVSGRHAELTYDGGQFSVKDLMSANGTFVDGEKIADATPLDVESAVTFGTVECLFVRTPPETGAGDDHSEKLVRHVVGLRKATGTQGKQILAEHAAKRRSVGELFVEQGILSPQEWSELYRQRASLAAASAAGRGLPRWLVFVLLAVALAAVLFFALR